MATAVAGALPRRADVALSQVVGSMAARALPARRVLVARHMKRALGADADEAEVRRATRYAFGSYARYWIESLRLPAMSGFEVDAGFSIEGMTHITDGRQRGKGVILALPHVGGWERAGAWLVRRGLPLNVVVEPLEPPELFEWFVGLRRSLGFNVIPLGDTAGSAVSAALARNEVVALLCDRDIGGGGVEVDFFGERTTMPAGPAALAMRTGAALVPAGVYFIGTGGHAVVCPPLECERRGRFREDLSRITQSLADQMEMLVRRAPPQWHLFQPNWPSDRLQGV